MNTRQPPLLDMTPEGEFRAPAFRLSWPMRIGLVALGVSFVAGIVATFALLVSLVLFIIPVALAAGVVAYVAVRLQLWRTKGGRQVVVNRR